MVTDLEESTAFYRDIVGLNVDREADGNVEFDTGQATLVLESDFEEDVLDAFGLDAPGDERGRGVVVAIEVDGPGTVDDICELVPTERMRLEPTDVDWGRRMAILSDPDDYAVEISAPL